MILASYPYLCNQNHNSENDFTNIKQRYDKMMKTIIIALTALFALSAQAACPKGSCQKATPAQQLMARLKQLNTHGTMVGHQDALFYGTQWKWEFGRSDMRDVAGDYPAVLGCDLGGIELASDRNLDGVPFDKMRQQIVDFAAKGGIVTLSWHPRNPATGGDAWDTSGRAVEAVLPGGKKHEEFTAWLDRAIAFVSSLRDSADRPVPVIFRPWHEMNGAWFWWGGKQCTRQQYKDLYKMTYDRFHEAGLTQVVWSYSPNADAAETEESFFSSYPGDAYVDILGTDIYQHGTRQDFISTCQKELAIMQQYAEAHGKLYAITETGYRNTPDPTWFTQTLLEAYRGYRPLYVLLWRNAWDNPEENFGPAPEKATTADFKQYFANDATLFLGDINRAKTACCGKGKNKTCNQ